MAARILWCVLTLGILAVFHLTVTKKQPRCRYIHRCFICKYPKATKDNCLEYRFCLKHRNGVCIKYEREEEKRTCGIKPPSCQGSCAITPPENYIVGGSQTTEGNWPWQVSLQTSSYNHVCGGVLIDNDWVLTAAHCVHNPNAKDFIAVLGEFDLKRRSGKEQFQRIKHIFVHPYYQGSDGNLLNDVALIQLKNDTHYNEYVSPICLPSFNEVISSNSCSITGWGETRGTGYRYRLRVLKVTLLDPAVCRNMTTSIYLPWSHICVNDGLTGACEGDSGGPLSCVRSSDGRFFVAGVASTIHQSCQKFGVPSFYTNIRTVVPWINKIIHSTKENP